MTIIPVRANVPLTEQNQIVSIFYKPKMRCFKIIVCMVPTHIVKIIYKHTCSNWKLYTFTKRFI